LEGRPITHLNFSGDAFVFLRFQRIWTTDELVARSRRQLASAPYPSSPQLLDHIEQVLAENGLALQQS
jgi:hypothetical protein